MTGRSWIPAEWMDEVIPTQGKSPNDFLKRNADGVLQLTPIDAEPDSTWPVATDLQPGQEVDFAWHEDRGYATLIVRDDGSWYCDPSFDADTNCITDDDFEIIADSVDDYVTQRKREGGLAPGPYELDGWVWSYGNTFTVKVLESGAAEFVEVAE